MCNVYGQDQRALCGLYSDVGASLRPGHLPLSMGIPLESLLTNLFNAFSADSALSTYLYDLVQLTYLDMYRLKELSIGKKIFY